MAFVVGLLGGETHGTPHPFIRAFARVDRAGPAQLALDDAIPCSVAVSAFSSADKERMQAVANFIENAFEQLDRRYTENGEAGIANERLRSALVGAAVGFCRQHQNSTIFIEATNAYRGMRALQAPAGTQE